MNTQISFKQMKSSEALREFTVEKSETLKKYFSGRINVTWTIGVEKKQKVVHVHLLGNNMDYFGEAKAEDARAAIEAALHKIERQIRKHKEVVKDHLHHEKIEISEDVA